MNIKKALLGSFILALILVAFLPDVVRLKASDTEFKAVYTVKQLKKAMKAKEASTIVFRTETYDDITIPYVKAAKNKTLYIVAPHAKVTNKSKFKSIIIKSMASFTEEVSGNVISWRISDNDEFIVAAGKSVKKLTFTNWYGGDHNYILREGASVKSLAVVAYDGTKSKTDKKKKTVSVVYHGEYEEGDHSVTYELNEYGNIIKRTSTPIDEEGGEPVDYAYKYDKNGNCIEKTWLKSGQVYISDVYEYDVNNNCIKDTRYNDSEEIYSCKYEYDAKGNVSKLEYGYTGKIKSVSEFKYDKKGRCIKNKIDGDDFDYLYTYKYDSAGRRVKETIKSTNYNGTTEYKYDKNGMLIEVSEPGKSYVTNYSLDYLGNRVFMTTNHVDWDGFLYGLGNVNPENEHLGDTQRYEDGFVSPVHDSTFNKKEYEKAGYTVVESVEELIQAIAPGAKIIIAPGRYNMSEYIENNDGYVSDYVVIDDNWADGNELVISYCDDLMISGAYTSAYVTELVIDPTHSAVIKFENCNNIKLNSLTLGHTEQGSCYGNVVQLDRCNDVGLYSVDLFGCGVYGIGANSACSDLRVYNSVIRDCSGGAFELSAIKGPVTFANCMFFDSEDGGWCSSGMSTPVHIEFKKCYFGEKETEALRSRDDLIFEDCLWYEVIL